MSANKEIVSNESELTPNPVETTETQLLQNVMDQVEFGEETFVDSSTEEAPTEEVSTEASEEPAQETEAPEEVPAEPEQKEEIQSDKWATLINTEKRLRLEKQALAQEKAAWEAQNKSTGESLEQWKARLRDDPLSVLNEVGRSFDDIALATIEGKPLKQPEAKKADPSNEEIKALRERLDRMESERQEKEAFREQTELRTNLTNVINNNPELSLLSSHPRPAEAMIEFANAYTEANGGVLDLTIDEIGLKVQEGWRQELSQLKSNKAVIEFFGGSVKEDQNSLEVPVNIPKKVPKKKETVSQRSADPMEQLVNSIPDDFWSSGESF